MKKSSITNSFCDKRIHAYVFSFLLPLKLVTIMTNIITWSYQDNINHNHLIELQKHIHGLIRGNVIANSNWRYRHPKWRQFRVHAQHNYFVIKMSSKTSSCHVAVHSEPPPGFSGEKACISDAFPLSDIAVNYLSARPSDSQPRTIADHKPPNKISPRHMK